MSPEIFTAKCAGLCNCLTLGESKNICFNDLKNEFEVLSTNVKVESILVKILKFIQGR